MTLQLPIYFDYAATTPVDQRVLEKMIAVLRDKNAMGKSLSTHAYLWSTR